ncbi:hypothetical protein O181_000159 [Austropuccinia psidii MF-1]|uniref:Uncharacterized protein n=1 Tax=Austropuccinia psidii MF-1 TaxID=1389203 RepID=A0A9Q3B825_9BASI|nr:hypothetical protein [Austropuccinia psidii MF-1]
MDSKINNKPHISLISFLKNPEDYIKSVPMLEHNGSNFYQWTSKLDQLFFFVFGISDFTKDSKHFQLTHQQDKAVCVLISKTVDPLLQYLFEDEIHAKDSFLILQKKFYYPNHNAKLEAFSNLMDLYKASKSGNPTLFEVFLSLFHELCKAGLLISLEIQSVLLKTAIPPPFGMSKDQWFQLITNRVENSNSDGPNDVCQAIKNYLMQKNHYKKCQSSQSLKGNTVENKTSIETLSGSCGSVGHCQSTCPAICQACRLEKEPPPM